MCQIILKSMHKCRSYGPDKLSIDHFIIQPSSVTLTFNLTYQMFHMALLHLKENNVPNYFEIHALHKCRSYGPDKLNYDHLII